MVTEAVIRLIRQTTARESDEYGNPVLCEEAAEIFATVNAVKRSEFYQGMAAGLKPEITFECYTFEYDGEKVVEYDGKRYNVIRAYPVKGERMEIICSDIIRSETEAV